MKRTKETFHKPHPNPFEREGVSGCKEFDGEDLDYDARTQYLKNQQKQWIEQQINEKEMMKNREKHEEDLYAKQVLEVTRMRQMLEDDFKRKKQSVQNSIKDENLILAQQKKDKEEQERLAKLREEREELALLQERGKSKPYRGAF